MISKRHGDSMAVLKCQKCRKEVTARDIRFITLPYAKAAVSMTGICKECYKELERWLNINEGLEKQADK